MTSNKGSDERVCALESLEFGTAELRPGGTVRIGRHRENDLVISDTMVSRFHARVAWDRGLERPVVFDNGSQNGTLVDGKPVRNAETITGDCKLSVGPYLIKVTLQGTGDTPAVLRDTNDLVTLFSDDGPDLSGELTPVFTVRHLLQRIETERRTGTLFLQGATGRDDSEVVFCLGRVMTARCEEGTGLRALERVVLARCDRFRFSRELEPQEDSLNLWVSDFLRTRNLDKGEPTKRFQATQRFARPGGGDR